MVQSPLSALTRRERQIMEIIYGHGRATAGEVHRELPDRPSYSTVRTLLRVLEEKGYLTHEYDGPRYVYSPAFPRNRRNARRSSSCSAPSSTTRQPTPWPPCWTCRPPTSPKPNSSGLPG